MLLRTLRALGVSPTVAGKLVVHFWPDKFAPIFRAAQRSVVYDPSPNDVVVYLGGTTLMSGSWSSEADFPGVRNINSCTLGKLPGHVSAWMAMEPNDPGALPPRMLIVNLSARLRQFHTALAKTDSEELIAERQGVATVAPEAERQCAVVIGASVRASGANELKGFKQAETDLRGPLQAREETVDCTYVARVKNS